MTNDKYSSTFTRMNIEQFKEHIAAAKSMNNAMRKIAGKPTSSEGTMMAVIARVCHYKISTEHWSNPITDEWIESRFLKVYSRETRKKRPTTYTVAYMTIYGKAACESCGASEHNGSRIPLQIDHKDGDAWNCLKSNLWAICPNCHSQQDTSIAGTGVFFANDLEAIAGLR